VISTAWATQVLAAAVPDGHLALSGHGEQRTFGELRSGTARFAHWLKDQGIGRGDRVAIVAEDRVDAIVAYLGIGLSGATILHINDRLAADEVAELFRLAPPSVVVTTAATMGKLAPLAAVRDARLVTIGADQPGAGATDGTAFESIVSAGSQTVPGVVVDPSDPAIIAFTSGTTGRPKGVVHTQQTIAKIIGVMPTYLGLRYRDRCGFSGTLSFPGGVWGVIMPFLSVGGTVSFMAGLPVGDWVDQMVVEGSHFTYAPSPLFTALSRAIADRPEVLATLRTVFHSGSLVPRADVGELIATVGERYVESYGLTETGAPLTATVPDDWGDLGTAQDMLSSAGRPTPVVEIRIVAADAKELPAGETGEIQARSPTMFAGYLGEDGVIIDATVDGWFATGDVGHVDSAGYLYVTDRLKDMIVTGGMNVFPAEVERVLATMPGVAEVAVFSIADTRWGETVTAAMVVSQGATVSEQDVIDFAREHLAIYKKPTRVYVVPELPRNANLKVLRNELRTMFTNAKDG
jgi:fatty-acyl-CoA synthase